ncbi:MAG: acetaldehyde dehydrogenase (acetylating) [Synergistaceae bacterium]|jgi:acetaldehyde dehydrogenase (acetylating)|nr:acetaldehyde dehydrogenase (acetylating) [Synergistaceae bacterium]
MNFDRDLCSIQEVRNLVARASEAQKKFAGYNQAQVDGLVEAIALECAAHAEPLAKMAVEETGFGVWQDKTLKNLLGSKMTWEYIRNMKTVGALNQDDVSGITEIGVGVGVVAALIPSTNPTSTVMYKSLISLKAGNAIIFSPHPGARRCIEATVKLIADTAQKNGAPDGLIGCVETLSIEATNELLRHRGIGMILATGGEAMVRAAYSSGNPALGVGPGNGPAYIEKTADIPSAVRHIIESKTFDNGTICASEQSVITECCIEQKVSDEFTRQGAYFLNEQESIRLAAVLLRSNGSMNPKVVGKSAAVIARMAGIDLSPEIRVLLSRQTEVSMENPYSREKLCPVLGFYVEENWREACARSIEILMNEGAGHTMTIHSENKSIINEFAMQKPVSRLLVNTAASLGGVGATTNLAPALTLGCGSIGGSATSDNVTPLHLINIRRVAWNARELESLRDTNPTPAHHGIAMSSAGDARPAETTARDVQFTREDIEAITRAVLSRFGSSGK